MITFIYGLKDPEDDQIKYVGKTVDPNKRNQEHVHRALRRPLLSKKNEWISSLVKKGLKPEMVILQTTIGDQWDLAEQRFIRYYGDIYPLFNKSNDGEDFIIKQGSDPWNKGLENPYSDETRKLMSESAKARGSCMSEEGRQKISDTHKGISKSKVAAWKSYYNGNARIYHQYTMEGELVASHVGPEGAGITKKRTSSHPLNRWYIRTDNAIFLIAKNKWDHTPSRIHPSTGNYIRKFTVQMDLNGNELAYYYDAITAAEYLNANVGNIRQACNSTMGTSKNHNRYKNFSWKYV